ncbi:YchJ family protein [Ochrovirga pacifica]|uniref:YchJ family protein n=1 Tax=Ochrovirga pacifica TaxID=1042376 RepID=UPI0002558B2E|nr:YchJ family protein [Ochrovirga pacifica]
MSKFSKLVQKQKERQEAKKTHFNLEAQTNANRQGLICACGSNQSYKSCCEPIHQNIHLAKTPEQLMRSRYTAYVLGNVDYLLQSHHSSTRPIREREEIVIWAKSVTWLRLEVLKKSEPLKNEGFVTFKAFFLENGQQQVIYEISRFVKENGHWTYIDGE